MAHVLPAEEAIGARNPAAAVLDVQGTDTIYDNDFGTMEVQLSFNGDLTNGDTGWMVTTCIGGHCEIFGYPLLVDLTKQ